MFHRHFKKEKSLIFFYLLLQHPPLNPDQKKVKESIESFLKHTSISSLEYNCVNKIPSFEWERCVEVLWFIFNLLTNGQIVDHFLKILKWFIVWIKS